MHVNGRDGGSVVRVTVRGDVNVRFWKSSRGFAIGARDQAISWAQVRQYLWGVQKCAFAHLQSGLVRQLYMPLGAQQNPMALPILQWS